MGCMPPPQGAHGGSGQLSAGVSVFLYSMGHTGVCATRLMLALVVHASSFLQAKVEVTQQLLPHLRPVSSHRGCFHAVLRVQAHGLVGVH